VTTPQQPSKPALLQQQLNAAARAQLSTTAHAVLAHLIADAWLKPEGWVATTSQTSLASRLAVHTATIARAVDELRELISYEPGRGCRRSRFVFSSVPAPVQTPSQRQCRDLPAPTLTPTQHRRGDIPIPRISSAAAATTPAADAAGFAQLVEERQEPTQETPSMPDTPERLQLVEQLLTRPAWLQQDRAWLDLETAQKLAALSTTTSQAIDWALTITSERRRTLDNPAGYFIARLRSPNLADIQRRAARRSQLSLRLTQPAHIEPKPSTHIDDDAAAQKGLQLTDNEIHQRRFASLRDSMPSLYAKLTRTTTPATTSTQENTQ
jgi:hypothetical protein